MSIDKILYLASTTRQYCLNPAIGVSVKILAKEKINSRNVKNTAEWRPIKRTNGFENQPRSISKFLAIIDRLIPTNDP